jgi:hypothetical protein
LGTMGRSDSSATCTSAFGVYPSRIDLILSDVAEASRFPTESFPTCLGSLTTPDQDMTRALARSRFAFHVGLPGRRPEWIFRSSISQPAVTAIYASIRTSRFALQDSRPEWFATPSP